MEPHPVPQNILDVEFKLFGSFTLKEFSKILIGGLAALGLYFVPGLPFYIKFPLMGLSVAIGFGLAIVPSLGVWIVGMLKSIFISPRYVWKKSAKTPDLLTPISRKQNDKNQNVDNRKNKNKVDLNEVSLRQILSTRSSNDVVQKATQSTPNQTDPFINDENKTQETNLDQLYANIYEHNKRKREEIQGQNIQVSQDESSLSNQSKTAEQVPLQETTQNTQVTNSVVASASALPVTQSVDLKKKSLQEQINQLKEQLNSIVKDENHKEKEAEILEQINDLYHELRTIGMNVEKKEEVVLAQVSEQGTNAGPGQSVFGVIVDRSENEIAGAKVVFTNTATNKEYITQTTSDGRFATDDILERGVYEVNIQKGNTRFNKYRIQVGDQKLPAYKFRSK